MVKCPDCEGKGFYDMADTPEIEKWLEPLINPICQTCNGDKKISIERFRNFMCESF